MQSKLLQKQGATAPVVNKPSRQQISYEEAVANLSGGRSYEEVVANLFCTEEEADAAQTQKRRPSMLKGACKACRNDLGVHSQ